MFGDPMPSGRQLQAVETALGKHFGHPVKIGSCLQLAATLIRELKIAAELDAKEAQNDGRKPNAGQSRTRT